MIPSFFCCWWYKEVAVAWAENDWAIQRRAGSSLNVEATQHIASDIQFCEF